MKTLEERIAELEQAQEAQDKTNAEHAEAIKNLLTPTGSSIAKKSEKIKVPTKEELEAAKVEVTYNANANKEGADKKIVKGNFSIKHPTLFYNGEVYPAAEALKNAALMTFYVEQTWLGPKNASRFVKEWV